MTIEEIFMKREDFAGRDFLALMDYTREEITYILDVAADFKNRLRRREAHDVLRGRTAMMIFEKLSTRTRISFQAACAHLGMQSFYTMPEQLQMKRGEPIKDTARVIDRYCDVLFMRTFGQEIVEEFASYMKNPVINALTDMTHPCQGLADLLTMREEKGHLEGLKVAYAGDVWNVCQSLMVAGALFGMQVTVARPLGYEPPERILKFIAEQAPKSGARVTLTDDLLAAVRDADVVYANTWHSMGGPEKSKEQRIQDFMPFQINEKVMSWAKKDAIFMHCLPGYRGEEMTEAVIEGPQSRVFEEAENRMHTEKAVLYLILSE
jgi:ornithine carbamoyltransferase